MVDSQDGTTSIVGMVGLGLLGSALADRLITNDFQVVGFDIDTDCCQQFESQGGQVATSAIEVISRCDRILLSLPDSSIVESVLAEVADELRSGQVIIDTTTGTPSETIAIAERMANQQIAFVDATVAGSSAQARAGDVIVMAGGSASVVESCRDIFGCFASRTIHVGESGNGAKMKLVVNLAIGLHRAVLAEALSFGESQGFDSATVLDALMAGPAHSRAMEAKGQKMVKRDFETHARLAQHLKDVKLILAEGASHNAKLPLSSWHAETLQALVDLGFGDEDNGAVLRAFL